MIEAEHPAYQRNLRYYRTESKHFMPAPEDRVFKANALPLTHNTHNNLTLLRKAQIHYRFKMIEAAILGDKTAAEAYRWSANDCRNIISELLNKDLK